MGYLFFSAPYARIFQFGFSIALLLSGFGSAMANETLENHCSVSTEKNGKLSTARTLYQNSCATYTLVDC
jgi:hypothetical protein